MKNSIKPIPDGYHTLTPHLVVKDASNAIEFYKKAFGAKEIRRVPGPDGKSLIHAELQVGDSRLLLVDEFPEMNCRGLKAPAEVRSQFTCLWTMWTPPSIKQ